MTSALAASHVNAARTEIDLDSTTVSSTPNEANAVAPSLTRKQPVIDTRLCVNGEAVPFEEIGGVPFVPLCPSRRFSVKWMHAIVGEKKFNFNSDDTVIADIRRAVFGGRGEKKQD